MWGWETVMKGTYGYTEEGGEPQVIGTIKYANLHPIEEGYAFVSVPASKLTLSPFGLKVKEGAPITPVPVETAVKMLRLSFKQHSVWEPTQVEPVFVSHGGQLLKLGILIVDEDLPELKFGKGVDGLVRIEAGYNTSRVSVWMNVVDLDAEYTTQRKVSVEVADPHVPLVIADSAILRMKPYGEELDYIPVVYSQSDIVARAGKYVFVDAFYVATGNLVVPLWYAMQGMLGYANPAYAKINEDYYNRIVEELKGGAA